MESNDQNQPEESPSSIFKQKTFLFLLISSVSSSLSMAMFLFSESWYVVTILNLEASLAFIYIASSVASILFTLIGGVIADRINRSNIMSVSEGLRGIFITLILVVLLIMDVVSLWFFVIIALINGILDAFFRPSRDSLIPSVVKKEQITRANSVLQTAYTISSIAGPMLAGLIIATGGFPLVFATIAICLFFGSITAHLTKNAPKNNSIKSTEVESRPKVINSAVEGLRFAKESRLLFSILLIVGLVNMVVTGPMAMGLPLFVANALNGTTLNYSFVEGSLAAGAVTGAILAGVQNKKRKRGKYILTSMLCFSIVIFLLSQTNFIWQAMLTIFVAGIIISLTNIPLISIVQSSVDEKMIGRVMSLLSLAAKGLTPASYAITSIILSLGIEIRTIMAISAIPTFILVLLLFWKVPAMRTLD